MKAEAKAAPQQADRQAAVVQGRVDPLAQDAGAPLLGLPLGDAAWFEALPREQLVHMLRGSFGDPLGAADLGGEQRLRDLELQRAELEGKLRLAIRERDEARQAVQRYRELYDYSPDASCAVDAEGHIEEANLTAASLLGVEPSALRGRLLTSFVAQADRARLRRDLKRCAAEGARTTCEVKVQTSAFGILPVQLVAAPQPGGEGAPRGCKVAMVDISGLKRAEQRQRLLADASAALGASFDVEASLASALRMLVPAIADVAFVDALGEDGRPRRVEVAATGAAETLAGALRRNPAPTNELLEPLLLTEAAPPALALVLGDAPDCVRVIEQSGVCSIMFVPLRTSEQSLGLLGLVSCSADRRFTAADLRFANDFAMRAAMALDHARLYRRATQAIEARQNVLSIVSHDLKTPLTSLVLNARMMLGRPPGAERRHGRTQLDRIHDSAAQMQRIIDDLLDAESIEAGRLSVEPRDHEVGALIRRAVGLLAPLARESAVRLEAVPIPEPVWARCDPARVLQVLTNLVGNAIKFTPQEGRIAVTVSIEERSIKVSVVDDGPGIPRSVMRHLFERFAQAKETAHRGRGLGLYISKAIVEAQGGAIWVESQQGKGTAAHFTLPLGAPPRDALRSSPPVVLIIEDDRGLRGALRDLLVSREYGVAVAANGREALDFLCRDGARPDLIILDMNLPELDGRAVLRAVKAEPSTAHIPVVVVSGSDETQEDGHALGAAAWLKKPVNYATLMAAISCRTPERK